MADDVTELRADIRELRQEVERLKERTISERVWEWLFRAAVVASGALIGFMIDTRDTQHELSWRMEQQEKREIPPREVAGTLTRLEVTVRDIDVRTRGIEREVAAVKVKVDALEKR